jgi:hypothetical protein
MNEMMNACPDNAGLTGGNRAEREIKVRRGQGKIEKSDLMYVKFLAIAGPLDTIFILCA